MKTGIAPRELLETPPDILHHMIRHLVPQQKPPSWADFVNASFNNG